MLSRFEAVSKPSGNEYNLRDWSVMNQAYKPNGRQIRLTSLSSCSG
jgi:hypothetical protein